MSYGILVKNIYDETQIDGVYKNFQVISSGTANATSEYSTSGLYLCPVYADFSRSQVVMGRSLSSAAGNIIGASSIFYPNNTLNIRADISRPMKYVILEPLSTVPPIVPGSHGLNIYDPTGLIVFSSANKNFIVDAAITITSGGFGSYQDIALPPVEFGRRYYQMLLRWGNQSDQEGYGVLFQELSPTSLRVWIDAYVGMSISFITGYFNE